MQNKEDKVGKIFDDFIFDLIKTNGFYSGVFEFEIEGVRLLGKKPIINVNIPTDYEVLKPYSDNSSICRIKGASNDISKAILKVRENALNVKVVDNNKKTFEGTLESFLSTLVLQVKSSQEKQSKK